LSGYSQIRGDQLWYPLAQTGVDANARNLFFFLLAPANERPTAGVRRYLPTEPLSFMPDWDQGTALEALGALERAGLVLYDPKAALIAVPLLLEMQPYKGHPAVAGAVGPLEGYPDSPVIIPALEHLAAAAWEAARTLRDKAPADAKRQEAALRSAEQTEDMARALEARLERIRGLAGAADTPPRGYRGGIEGGCGQSSAGQIPPRGGIEGVSRGGAPGGENGAAAPENAPAEAPPGGYRGGPGGVSRGHPRARGGVRDPEPKPEPEPKPPGRDPPGSPPRADPNPPTALGQILDKARGK